MSFTYEEKESDSKFVDAIWRTCDQADGVYTAPADGRWDLIFITSGNRTKVILSSPTSRPTQVAYQAGNKNFGIRFHPSTFMSHVSTPDTINKLYSSYVTDDIFFLFGNKWPLPTYETVEDFIKGLEKAQLLGQDDIVRMILDGETPTITKRSVQRHFKRSTGLSKQYHSSIKQAEQALRLLETTQMPIIEIAHLVEYADQAHMTRSLKRFIGLTPAEIIRPKGTK